MYITKKFKTLSEAEKHLNKLYNEYHEVKITSYPLFSENGNYTFYVEKRERTNDRNKNLYVSGYYKDNEQNGTDYNLVIFGGINEEPVVYIKEIEIKNSNYNDVDKKCREIYCDYFNVDDYNIISIIHPLKVK